MNWSTFSRPAVATADFTGRKPASSPLHLEGSLAAVVTLAPVIPMFPAIVVGRFGRRRTTRGKA
ncbi:MAG: hypothetical protein HZC55_02000 [Verrucomicrobia bacterium]|nr:hypothetical protein [Verrucomicrobiota bacterium]